MASRRILYYTNPLKIGDTYLGGKIAYLDGTGIHGFIAQTSDLTSIEEWGCRGTGIPGADGINIGTGKQNTTDICNGCAGAQASRSCVSSTVGGYNDWFLPSKNEMNELYKNRVILGGFVTYDGYYYWCSSEYDDYSAWYFHMYGNNWSYGSKYAHLGVRAIRNF